LKTDKDIVTTTTAILARLCGVTRETATRWVRQGLLPGATQGANGRYRIPRQAAEAFAAEYSRERFRSEPRAVTLTAADVVDIRDRLAGGERAGDLAAEYGVETNYLRRIGHGYNWSHVGGPRTTPRPRQKLDETGALDIRERHAAGERTADLAREYGVASSTIGAILQGRRWKQAGGPLSQAPSPARISDEDVRRLREEYAQARARGRPVTLAALGEAYGVSESTVSLLVRGKRRREAGGPMMG
jgi:transcriptional regulator with XRE-family HTH domain